MNTSHYIIFIKKVALLLVLLIVIDRSLGYVMKTLYFSEPQGESSVTTYALDKTTEPFLIFGSSRASHHYDSKWLSAASGMPVYNCGRDGVGIRYSNVILKAILERYTPKLIVLDVNLNELCWKAGKEGDDILVSGLLPYIGEHESLRKALAEIDPKEVMKARVSLLYRFNSMPISIVQHHLHIGQKSENGYLPLYGSHISDSLPEFVSDSVVKGNDTLRRDFLFFVQQCKQKNVKLLVCISPIWGNKNLPDNRAEMQNILNREGVPFLDFSQTPQVNQAACFYDQGHLNAEGVKIYDSLLLDKMRQIQILPLQARTDQTPSP